MNGINEYIPMTRRYPDLKPKQLQRDAKIARQLINAWDIEKDEQKVMSIFIKGKDLLSHPRYWELMRTVWIVSGSVNNASIFCKLMKSDRPYRNYFMSPEDEKIFQNLPDKFMVYRACNFSDDGISWTTNKEYAEFYKKRFSKDTISEMKIQKSECFAYINRNGEEEVLILKG